VDSHDFRVSNSAGDVLKVDATNNDVIVSEELKLSAAAAMITHTGGTTLTVSSVKLVLTGGALVLDGSAQSTGPTVNTSCTKGSVQFDDQYLYLCMGSTPVWKRVELAAA
jgi:hypothetical protein